MKGPEKHDFAWGPVRSQMVRVFDTRQREGQLRHVVRQMVRHC